MSFIADPNFPSPIQWNGHPATPMGRLESTYEIFRNKEGVLIVRCHCEMPVARLKLSDNSVVEPEVGARAKFTYEIAISSKGVATIEKPLEVEHELDPWSTQHGKSYPRPTQASDLFGSHASKQLGIDIREFGRGEFSGENFNFLDTLDSVSTGSWEKEDAQKIFNEFIKEGTKQQVNISNDLLKEIKNALDIWNDLPLHERVALFNKARDEVRNLIWTGFASRFIKEPNKFAEAPASRMEGRP
jgi:hypothetical protein